MGKATSMIYRLLFIVVTLIIIVEPIVHGQTVALGYEVLHEEYKGFYTGDGWAIVVLENSLKIYSVVGNYSVKNPFNPNVKYFFVPSAKLVVALKPGGLLSLPKLGVIGINGTIVKEFSTISTVYIGEDKVYYTYKRSSGKSFGKYMLFLRIVPGNRTLNLTNLALKYNETAFQITPAEDGEHLCLMGVVSHRLLILDVVTGDVRDYGKGWSHAMYPYLDGCILLPKLDNSTVWFVNWDKKIRYDLLAGRSNASLTLYLKYYSRVGEQVIVPYEIAYSVNKTKLNNTLGVLIWKPKENRTYVYEITGEPKITQFFSGKDTKPLVASKWGVAVAVNKYEHAKPGSSSIVNAWTELHLVLYNGVKHVFKLPLMNTKSLVWVGNKLYYSFASTTGSGVTGVIDVEAGKIVRQISSNGLYLVPFKVDNETVIVALPSDWGRITLYNRNLDTMKTLKMNLAVKKYAIVGRTLVGEAETDKGNIVLALNPAKIIEIEQTAKTSPTASIQTTNTQSNIEGVSTGTATKTTKTTMSIETSSPSTPETTSNQHVYKTATKSSSSPTTTSSNTLMLGAVIAIAAVVIIIVIVFLRFRKHH